MALGHNAKAREILHMLHSKLDAPSIHLTSSIVPIDEIVLVLKRFA
jgi:hypothetical protein